MASRMLQKLAKDDVMRVTLLSIEKVELDRSDELHHAHDVGLQERPP